VTQRTPGQQASDRKYYKTHKLQINAKRRARRAADNHPDWEETEEVEMVLVRFANEHMWRL